MRTVEEDADPQAGGAAAAQVGVDVAEREAGVHHVLDDQDVAADDLGIEVLEEANARMPTGIRVGAVRRELDEVEGVGDADGPRQVRDEDEARLQRRDEERLTAVVVADDLAPELTDAVGQLLPGEVDLADVVPRGA